VLLLLTAKISRLCIAWTAALAEMVPRLPGSLIADHIWLLSALLQGRALMDDAPSGEVLT
jgi:hypothetical protein